VSARARRLPASSATRWMTKFPSRIAAAILGLALAGCAASSGQRVERITQPAIAAAYLPLTRHIHLGLDSVVGAAVVIAPGIAATNAHNANIVAPEAVIGIARDYDLMFFRTTDGAVAATAAPVVGGVVTAYGEGLNDDLRVAHGTVRQIVTCPGCSLAAYFTFANDRRGGDDAGPGFSGGPVVDAQGRQVGITFGYKDEGGKRLIYAYDMARVRAEFQPFESLAR
jgi:hypothetical protein